MKRKLFYVMMIKKGVMGIAQKDGYEFKINNKKYNGYIDEFGDGHIIDPKTGLSLFKYYAESFTTKLEAMEYAVDKLSRDSNRLRTFEEKGDSEVYKLMIERFNAYKKGVKLNEKIMEHYGRKQQTDAF